MAYWSNVSCLKGRFWFKPLAGHHASTDNFVFMNRITEIFRLCNYLGRNLNRLARTLTEILTVIAPESLPFSRICVREENLALFFCVCVLLSLLFFLSRFDAYNVLFFIDSEINSAWNLKTLIINYVFSLALVFSPGLLRSPFNLQFYVQELPLQELNCIEVN